MNIKRKYKNIKRHTDKKGKEIKKILYDKIEDSGLYSLGGKVKRSFLNAFFGIKDSRVFFSEAESIGKNETGYNYYPFSKIIGSSQIKLSDKNKFGCNTINNAADLFYNDFVKYNPEDTKEYYWGNEIKKYNKRMMKHENSKKEKELKLLFNGEELTNKQERGNVITYDYKGQQIVMYMMSNSELRPVCSIVVNNKEGTEGRHIGEMEVRSGLIKEDKELVRAIEKGGTLIYPFYVLDMNVYDIDIFTKELLFYFHFSIRSLFFNENAKFLSYFKSLVLRLKDIAVNFLSDNDIRNKVVTTTKEREFYAYSKSLNNLIPGSFSLSYYYIFYNIKGKLMPCRVKVKEIKETRNHIIIDTEVSITSKGYTHKTILGILDRVNGIQPISYKYQNLEDFDVKKDINFITYEQLKVVDKIIDGYNIINFNSNDNNEEEK